MNLIEYMFAVMTSYFWSLLDMSLLKVDRVPDSEYTCLDVVPRKVDCLTFVTDNEFFESLILCL